MPLRFKIAGNTLAQFVSKAVSSTVTLFITVIIARQYGAEGYGDFTKIFVYVVVFYLLVDFGLNAIFLRESKKKHSQFHIASLLSVRVIFSIFLVFFSLAILAFLPYSLYTGDGFSPLVKLGIILLSPTIMTMGLQSSFNALFQKHLRYDKATVASVLGSITTISVVVILSRLQASIPILVTAYLAGGIITVVTAYILSKSLTSWDKVIWLDQLKKGSLLIKLSIPLGLTLFFSVIHFRADVFILTVYRSTAEVGIYGLSSKFFEFTLTVPTFFMNALYPVLLTVISDQKKSADIIKKAIGVLSVIALIIMTVSFIFAPYLTLIKEDFADSILPFRILIIALPLFFVSSVLMWYLIAKNRNWQLVWIYAAGMIVNIILNIIFIPQYGIVAAAVSTGVSEALLTALLAYAVLPLFRTKSNKLS